jgi:ABC-2 type transport system ATP-binding protein
MITMQNVRKKYKDFELELSLEIPEGRITGFVGKNGAGKSTAIKLILGLVKPDAGKICVFGNEGGELPAAVRQALVHNLRWKMSGISLLKCILISRRIFLTKNVRL